MFIFIEWKKAMQCFSLLKTNWPNWTNRSKRQKKTKKKKKYNKLCSNQMKYSFPCKSFVFIEFSMHIFLFSLLLSLSHCFHVLFVSFCRHYIFFFHTFCAWGAQMMTLSVILIATANKIRSLRSERAEPHYWLRVQQNVDDGPTNTIDND